MSHLRLAFFVLHAVALLFLPVRQVLAADRAIAFIQETFSGDGAEANSAVQVQANVEKRLVGWTEYDSSTCQAMDTGTWGITTPPGHGELRFALENHKLSNGECAGETMIFNVAIYTWTDDAPGEVEDSFSIVWFSDDGLYVEPSDWVVELVPVEVVPHQISFNWQGSSAITMYDACDNEPISVPEYDAGTGTNNPAAFARGNGPLKMLVKWRTTRDDLSRATVWASGSFGGVGPVEVPFVNGESDWISMETNQSIPARIQSTQASFKWKYSTASSPNMTSSSTTHVIYTTNKTPLSTPVYLDLVKWTTEWCQPLRNLNDKSIADAILKGFASSNVIRYASAAAYDTQEILCKGGGMCGGMMEVFYDACATQGVHVARSCYTLQDADPGLQDKWVSIIIYSPGLGQDQPTFHRRRVRAADSVFPCPKYYGDFSTDDDIEAQARRVYEFFAPDDGHCINFLTYNGKIYLYDLSFGTGPFANLFDTLPSELTTGKELAHFRQLYFNTAVDYMRGQISFQGTDTPCAFKPDAPYLDVKTSIIPYNPTSLALYWYLAP